MQNMHGFTGPSPLTSLSTQLNGGRQNWLAAKETSPPVDDA